MHPVIVVHGGAGRLRDPGDSAPREAGCRRGAEAGWVILRNGGSALDAVEAAVQVLEDDPLFNAGTGSVLGQDGAVEMDASIMDGATARAGAVAAVRRIRNPVRLARRVLEHGRHVLLVAEGAARFAREAGIPECREEDLVTDAQRRRFERHGTVGAVALDRDGRLAAATSTGGTAGNLPGRVGDSALIGCGTYADEVGACSCTGIGEAIVRVVLAHTATELLRAGQSPDGAAQRAIALLADRTGSEAGLILVDRLGRIGHAHNCEHMAIAVHR
jgi:L-asparaginase / beta-aspartyl-peptidase